MQRVAVYGSLKEGFHNSTLLKGSSRLGEDVIQGWRMISLGAFPGILRGEEEVHIEVYEVNDEVFASLDRLEGFPHFYNRTQVDTKYGKSWVYYLNNHSRYANHERVEGGRWR